MQPYLTTQYLEIKCNTISYNIMIYLALKRIINEKRFDNIKGDNLQVLKETYYRCDLPFNADFYYMESKTPIAV